MTEDPGNTESKTHNVNFCTTPSVRFGRIYKYLGIHSNMASIEAGDDAGPFRGAF